MRKLCLIIGIVIIIGFGIEGWSYLHEGKGAIQTIIQQKISFDQIKGKETSHRILKSFHHLENDQISSLYLVAGGDIMISRNIGALNRKYGYDRIFKEENLYPITSFPNCTGKNCLLFFNLESLFSKTDNDDPYGGFIFKSNLKNIETLLQLRGDHQILFSLANNHTSNVGHEGVVTTRELLKEHQLPGIGVGENSEESREMYILQQKNLKICFSTYSYDGNAGVIVRGGKISWNPMRETDILEDLEKMKTLQCDAKIISLHRGNEYRIKPTEQQKQLAYHLIDAGADLILGNHSHIPSAFERYKGKMIFYSFGNFIFDQERGKTENGRGFDYIYDYSLKRKTVPTYLSLLGGFLIFKRGDTTEIILDKLVMDTTTQGVHFHADEKTSSEYLEQLNLSKIPFTS